MQYMGGKSKISKQIGGIINEIYGRQIENQKRDSKFNRERERESNVNTFVSLFCGSCSIESKVNIPNKILNDNHYYLIEMWKGLQNGRTFPDIITDENYYYIKEHKDEDPCLTGFVGFGCSFGGKWFGGVAHNKKGDNYCARANRSVMKDLEGLRTAQFTCLDYRDVVIPDGSIVYCDPPYANTTSYTTGNFNSREFWDYMRKISEKNIVLISEQNAPEDFECIWEKPFTRTLDVNKDNQFKVTEKLFKFNG